LSQDGVGRLADELAYTTATELAARIRRRELSPVEVVDAFIERIEARNPSLDAFVYSGFDDARQRAREAEQALVSGAELGVLHGVPTAIKDFVRLQGRLAGDLRRRPRAQGLHPRLNA
jgi:amidase